MSSFLLKTVERLIDVYLRITLTQLNFHQAKHAYQKGRSVETALHGVVGTIVSKLNILATFLNMMAKYLNMLATFQDIENAFNNVKSRKFEKDPCKR